MRRVAAVVAVGAVALAAAGCAGGAGGGGIGSNSITQAQYASIKPGQHPAALRARLGKPESIDLSQIQGLGKSAMWTYSGPNDTTVVITIGRKLSQTTFKPVGGMVVESKSIG
jgi:hypothetical protein